MASRYHFSSKVLILLKLTVLTVLRQYWTIGKIIDKIAAAAKLKNENNVNVTEKKLRLINRNSGELLTLQDTLEYLLSDDDEPLLNGSAVIMEYVNKNLSSVLPDLDKYPR